MVKETMIQMGFWLAWLVIPALFELVPAIRAWVQNHFFPAPEPPEQIKGRWPQVTVIVPVHNSAATLPACLDSIDRSTYPNDLLHVICANNNSSDNSRAVFQDCQTRQTGLQLQWLETQPGKARALNSAIYTSTGDYVVTLDSDGTLAPAAIMNLVKNFLAHPEVQAQTGTILSNRQLVEAAPNRHLARNEYLEYAVAFLAGRTTESQADQLFTMAGAFSAFRRSALVQTRLYNVDTVGEDTDMTFQVRYVLKGRVILCPNAVFYVEPATGWDELYVQRQRWQRGEIEVVRAFMADHLSLRELFSNFLVRRLIVDHTVAFLKVIWLFAILVLIPFGYSPVMLAFSLQAMYALYLLITALNLSNVLKYLKFDPAERDYCKHRWPIVFSLPAYNLILSLFRVMGVINTMLQPARWNPASMRTEAAAIGRVLRHDWHFKKEKEHD